MKIKQTENQVKAVIKRYLEIKGYKVYRINNCGVYRGKNAKGGDRFSFAGDAGVADLYATKTNACPIWVECKATGKHPSESQEEFGKDVNDTIGTIWIWADSLNMLIGKMPFWGGNEI